MPLGNGGPDGGASAPARISGFGIAAFATGLLGTAAILAGIFISNYGVRRFEIEAGYPRAQLVSEAGAVTSAGLFFLLVAIVLGHISQWRLRTSILNRGRILTRIGLLLGYGSIVFFFGFLSQHPTDWPPLIATTEDTALATLRDLNEELSGYRQKAGKGSFPQRLEQLDAEGAGSWTRFAKNETAPYELEYVAVAAGATGQVSQYQLTARAREFGKTGRANFFTDQTGVVRWTAEDRPATAKDRPFGRPRWTRPEPEGEETLVPYWLAQVSQCALRYRRNHPERGFPETMHELAATGCVIPEIAAGQRAGYVYRYLPWPAGPDGRIASYRMEARPADFNYSGRWSFMTDQFGQVRGMSEDRAATSSDPVVHSASPAEGLARAYEGAAQAWITDMTSCLATYALRDPRKSFPPDLAALADRVRGEVCPRAARDSGEGYRYAYVPGPGNGRGAIRAYVLTARPLEYAQTGRRSFLSDQSGNLHFTSEDREAALSDPFFKRTQKPTN